MRLGFPWAGLESRLDVLMGFLYPNCCQICNLERATAREGFVGEQCRSRPGGVRFVQPPVCGRCGLPYDGEIAGEFECSNCREMALFFSRAQAAVVASNLILDVVHRYKYRGAVWFEPFLAGLLVDRAGDRLQREGWDVIVPVPLHPVKAREREFNQAERLAARLSEATGIPALRGVVKRVAYTETQTRLSRPRRAANVRNAFRCGATGAVGGKRVVLVDDVLTTGATTSECARALLRAGAGEVCVWTVARGT